MILAVALLAAALGGFGALAIYVTSPNQRLLARRPAWPLAAALGGLLLLVATGLLQQVMGPAAAVYSILMLAMTIWTALPFALTFGKRGGRG